MKMKTKKQLQEQIDKLQEELKEIELKENTLIIETPYGKIEIQKEIHHKDKTYKECKKDCPKEWQIPTYEILQFLRNSKYVEELNLIDTWEFIINPDEISKKNNYITWFDANSGRAILGWSWSPDYCCDTLRVRYMRFIK